LGRRFHESSSLVPQHFSTDGEEYQASYSPGVDWRGKQSLAENHGIARLSLLAMVFLPFSSVATILGMQGSFSPGDKKFWLFWVVAIALTTFVVGMFLLYDRIVQRLRVHFPKVSKMRQWRKRKCRNSDEEHELRAIRQ